ncbi:MAG: winged helix-turn-helix domain-containing protein [Caldilineaceae bacterium]|nr:winged helix-turn-helix domain-containing protein [Caldilineaceae bacterium]
MWGFAYIDEVDYLRVYIWHLRRKLEPDPKHPIYFLNELNTGYRFSPQHG